MYIYVIYIYIYIIYIYIHINLNLNLKFHWQFLITYFGFYLINTLLQIFDISSQKRNEKEKKTYLLMKKIKEKQKKMLRKYA